MSKPTITSQMQIFVIWQQPGDATRSGVYQQLRSSCPFPSIINPYRMSSNINLRAPSDKLNANIITKPEIQLNSKTQSNKRQNSNVNLPNTGNVGVPFDTSKQLLLPIKPSHFQELKGASGFSGDTSSTTASNSNKSGNQKDLGLVTTQKIKQF